MNERGDEQRREGMSRKSLLIFLFSTNIQPCLLERRAAAGTTSLLQIKTKQKILETADKLYKEPTADKPVSCVHPRRKWPGAPMHPTTYALFQISKPRERKYVPSRSINSSKIVTCCKQRLSLHRQNII